jgi:hypothetical protein
LWTLQEHDWVGCSELPSSSIFIHSHFHLGTKENLTV